MMAACFAVVSNVGRRQFSKRRGRVTVLHENFLLANKGDEFASCSLRFDFPSQSSLTRAYSRFLLRAIAAPFHGKMIGVGNCVELAGEA